MDSRKLSDRLTVAAQIGVADIAIIKAQGFRAVICNRPDGEAPDQPDFAEIAAAAHAAGLQTRFVPIFPTGISDSDLLSFAEAMQELPAPVLAYCRTGTRSGHVALQSGCLNDD